MSETLVKAPYSLPRDEDETERLNSQHLCFKSAAGYLLHPRIEARANATTEPFRVADVGAGTGVWLYDVSATYPTHKLELYGLDISDEQFPPGAAAQTPAGHQIDYAVSDILEEPAQKFRGYFDVVHIRLLVCGVSTEDWVTVAKNVNTMLKPGGYIQWQEINAGSAVVYPAIPEASTQYGQRMIDSMVKGQRRFKKFMPEDFVDFRERVESAGFLDTILHKPSSDRDPDSRQNGTMVTMRAMNSLLRWSAKNDPEYGWTIADCDEVYAKAREEAADGKAYWRWDMYLIIGRKAGGEIPVQKPYLESNKATAGGISVQATEIYSN